MIDPHNPVIKLCIAGTQGEFQGQMEQARRLYQQAWESAQDDYEACIAAHYVAQHQDDPQDSLHWNQVALQKARAVSDPRVDEFYPSIYLNLGQSCEILGKLDEAQHYYDLAAELGFPHAT